MERGGREKAGQRDGLGGQSGPDQVSFKVICKVTTFFFFLFFSFFFRSQMNKINKEIMKYTILNRFIFFILSLYFICHTEPCRHKQLSGLPHDSAVIVS